MVWRTERGITLIEILISLAISSIVVVSLLGLVAMHVGMLNKNTARGQLGVDTMYMMDYFSRVIPSAGGEILPVWSAIYVENNCSARGPFPDCGGSDRISVTNISGTRTCAITSSNVGRIYIDKSSGTCCLKQLSVNKAQVLLIRVTSVGERFVSLADDSPTGCYIDVSDGPTTPNDNVANTFDWSGGVLVPVTISTYYLDRTSRELNRFTFTNGGTSFDGHNSPMADRVMDFQVALGFDFNPLDGAITDAGDNNDEYLYNWPSGTETLGTGFMTNATWSMLRMVAVGIMLGAPSTSPTSSSPMRLLDGPLVTQPTWLLESKISRYMVRSTRVFQ